MKKEQHKLRILCNNNAPWASSGYAQQARQFLPAMAAEGYPTACSAFYGLEGGIVELDNITFYPKMRSTWGEDAMVEYSKHFNADVVLSLQDIWVLDTRVLKTLADMGKKWVTLVPIDHDPIPPAILERARMAYRVLAMSPFGHRELKRVGINSTYMPHTVQTELFKQYDKKEVRKSLNIPEDMFIFGMVAANKDNPPRKGFQHALDAFALFQKEHPNSGIYFHTLTNQPGGFQIDEYASNLKIKNVFITPPVRLIYDIPPDEIAKIYSAFDCLLAPSTSEGFGIPIIEAQSCQVPVITTKWTSMTDLVKHGETGYLCDRGYKRFDPLGSYVFETDYTQIYEYMEEIFKADRVKMGLKARRFVMDNFDFKLVWEKHWKPWLEKIEKECYLGDNKKS